MLIKRQVLNFSLIIGLLGTLTYFANARFLPQTIEYENKEKFELSRSQRNTPSLGANGPELYTLPRPIPSIFNTPVKPQSTPTPTTTPPPSTTTATTTATIQPKLPPLMNDVEYDLRLRQLMEELVLGGQAYETMTTQINLQPQQTLLQATPTMVAIKHNSSNNNNHNSNTLTSFTTTNKSPPNQQNNSSSSSSTSSSPSLTNSVLDYVLLEFIMKNQHNLTQFSFVNSNSSKLSLNDSQTIQQQLEFLQKNAEKFKKFQQVQERGKNSTTPAAPDSLWQMKEFQRNSLNATTNKLLPMALIGNVTESPKTKPKINANFEGNSKISNLNSVASTQNNYSPPISLAEFIKKLNANDTKQLSSNVLEKDLPLRDGNTSMNPKESQTELILNDSIYTKPNTERFEEPQIQDALFDGNTSMDPKQGQTELELSDKSQTELDLSDKTNTKPNTSRFEEPQIQEALFDGNTSMSPKESQTELGLNDSNYVKPNTEGFEKPQVEEDLFDGNTSMNANETQLLRQNQTELGLNDSSYTKPNTSRFEGPQIQEALFDGNSSLSPKESQTELGLNDSRYTKPNTEGFEKPHVEEDLFDGNTSLSPKQGQTELELSDKSQTELDLSDKSHTKSNTERIKDPQMEEALFDGNTSLSPKESQTELGLNDSSYSKPNTERFEEPQVQEALFDGNTSMNAKESQKLRQNQTELDLIDLSYGKPNTESIKAPQIEEALFDGNTSMIAKESQILRQNQTEFGLNDSSYIKRNTERFETEEPAVALKNLTKEQKNSTQSEEIKMTFSVNLKALENSIQNPSGYSRDDGVQNPANILITFQPSASNTPETTLNAEEVLTTTTTNWDLLETEPLATTEQSNLNSMTNAADAYNAKNNNSNDEQNASKETQVNAAQKYLLTNKSEGLNQLQNLQDTSGSATFLETIQTNTSSNHTNNHDVISSRRGEHSFDQTTRLPTTTEPIQETVEFNDFHTNFFTKVVKHQPVSEVFMDATTSQPSNPLEEFEQKEIRVTTEYLPKENSTENVYTASALNLNDTSVKPSSKSALLTEAIEAEEFDVESTTNSNTYQTTTLTSKEETIQVFDELAGSYTNSFLDVTTSHPSIPIKDFEASTLSEHEENEIILTTEYPPRENISNLNKSSIKSSTKSAHLHETIEAEELDIERSTNLNETQTTNLPSELKTIQVTEVVGDFNDNSFMDDVTSQSITSIEALESSTQNSFEQNDSLYTTEYPRKDSSLEDVYETTAKMESNNSLNKPFIEAPHLTDSTKAEESTAERNAYQTTALLTEAENVQENIRNHWFDDNGFSTEKTVESQPNMTFDLETTESYVVDPTTTTITTDLFDTTKWLKESAVETQSVMPATTTEFWSSDAIEVIENLFEKFTEAPAQSGSDHTTNTLNSSQAMKSFEKEDIIAYHAASNANIMSYHLAEKNENVTDESTTDSTINREISSTTAITDENTHDSTIAEEITTNVAVTKEINPNTTNAIESTSSYATATEVTAYDFITEESATDTTNTEEITTDSTISEEIASYVASTDKSIHDVTIIEEVSTGAATAEEITPDTTVAAESTTDTTATSVTEESATDSTITGETPSDYTFTEVINSYAAITNGNSRNSAIIEEITADDTITEGSANNVAVLEEFTTNASITQKITANFAVTEEITPDTTIAPDSIPDTNSTSVTEESPTDAIITREITSDDTITNEITSITAITEENARDSIITEETTTDGASTEEISPDNTITEEISTDAPNTEKITLATAIGVERTPDSTITAEITADDSITEESITDSTITRDISTDYTTTEEITHENTRDSTITTEITTDDSITEESINDDSTKEKFTEEIAPDSAIIVEIPIGLPITAETPTDVSTTEGNNSDGTITEITSDSTTTEEISSDNTVTEEITTGLPITAETTTDVSVTEDDTSENTITEEFPTDNTSTGEISPENSNSAITEETTTGRTSTEEISSDKTITEEIPTGLPITAETTPDISITEDDTSENTITEEFPTANTSTGEISPEISNAPITDEITTNRTSIKEIASDNTITEEIPTGLPITAETTTDISITEANASNPKTTTHDNSVDLPITTERFESFEEDTSTIGTDSLVTIGPTLSSLNLRAVTNSIKETKENFNFIPPSYVIAIAGDIGSQIENDNHFSNLPEDKLMNFGNESSKTNEYENGNEKLKENMQFMLTKLEDYSSKISLGNRLVNLEPVIEIPHKQSEKPNLNHTYDIKEAPDRVTNPEQILSFEGNSNRPSTLMGSSTENKTQQERYQTDQTPKESEANDDIRTVTEIVWLTQSTSIKKPAIIIDNVPYTANINRPLSKLSKDPAKPANSLNILKPADNADNLSELIEIIGNSLHKSQATIDKDVNTKNQQKMENNDKNYKLKMIGEEVIATVNCHTTTMAFTVTGADMSTITDNEIQTQDDDESLTAVNDNSAVGENVEKWPAFLNNQLNNDSLTKSGNVIISLNANTGNTNDKQAAATAAAAGDEVHGDDDDEGTSNAATRKPNNERVADELKVNEENAKTGDNVETVEMDNNDKDWQATKIEGGINEMSTTIENKLTDISKHKSNAITEATSSTTSTPILYKKHEMLNKNAKTYEGNSNSNKAEDDQIHEDTEDHNSDRNNQSFSDMTLHHHPQQQHQQHLMPNVYRKPTLDKTFMLSDQTKEEITATNWWHSLPYKEIRKFLNSIFDSVPTTIAIATATAADTDDFILNETLNGNTATAKKPTAPGSITNNDGNSNKVKTIKGRKSKREPWPTWILNNIWSTLL